MGNQEEEKLQQNNRHLFQKSKSIHVYCCSCNHIVGRVFIDRTSKFILLIDTRHHREAFNIHKSTM